VAAGREVIRWAIRLVAIASITLYIALIVVDTVRGWPLGPYSVVAVLLNMSIALVYVSIGWLISERRPGNPIGPMLLAIGVVYALAGPVDLYLSLPEVARIHENVLDRLQDPGRFATTEALGSAAVLFLAIVEFPITVLGLLALILFPDGRPPSRWRWVVPSAVLLLLSGVIGVSLEVQPPFGAYPSFASPLGIEGFPGARIASLSRQAIAALQLAVVFVLIGRWRRGDAADRAQVKWVAVAVIVFAASQLLNLVNQDRPYDWQTVLMGLAVNAAFMGVAIAIAIAILRYRLYAIDRIVSRGISYGVVTAVLGATFVGIVLALQAVLAPFTKEQTIAVAASTLAVFALFQPLRRRVQAAVDRRFDRTRYDADLTVRTFADRLRGDLDLGTVSAEIVGTASAAVRPRSAGVWLRGAK
jgi:hypothetical protein